jgi:acetyltransferase-like isoleucine patch superfamily enzyme
MKLRSPRLRTLVAAAAVLAPSRVRRFLHVRLLGYEIDPTARIGRSLIDVEEFRAGPRASVASLTLIRGLYRLEMDEAANIGALVWINAVRRDSPALRADLDRDPSLVLHRSAGFTPMHFVDCCDRIELQQYAMIGGAMSQILTHSFDYREAQHYCAPVEIGEYSIVGTKSLLLPGTRIGARSIVAGGSVLNGEKYPDLKLIAGVPAKAKSDLDPDAKMFHRSGDIH